MSFLNASDIPAEAAPAESTSGSPPNDTAYLSIDLKNLPTGETPMTAVFAPDPKSLSATVDVILWFHGHRGSYISPKTKTKINLSGFSAQKYLKDPDFALRDFIKATSKKNFLLVVPTLNDNSDYGILGKPDEAGAFLQQALNGAKQHLGAPVATVGNVIFGAHSGGYKILCQMANFETDPAKKTAAGALGSSVKEIWGIDCTYGTTGSILLGWAKRASHAHDRLFVYASTPSAGTVEHAKVVYDGVGSSSFIAVGIGQFPGAAGSLVKNFTGFPTPFDHNATVDKFFSKLITTSTVLT